MYARRTKQIEKTDKAREDYEFERLGDECTFAPQIFTKKPARKNDAKKVASQRQQETLNKQMERQKKAREEKERIKNLTKRGYGGGKAKPAKSTQKPVDADQSMGSQDNSMRQSIQANSASGIGKGLP